MKLTQLKVNHLKNPSFSFVPETELEGGKRYYWDVTAQADDGDQGTSAVEWFEGGCGASWNADWITSPYGFRYVKVSGITLVQDMLNS